jgi:hypothetical protein
MALVGFEPAKPSTKRPQTYALDHAATGIGSMHIYIQTLHEYIHYIHA